MKTSWGQKRKCVTCGTSFYDMGKKEFQCPKCGASYSSDAYADATTKKLLKSIHENPETEEQWDENALENGELFGIDEDMPADDDLLNPEDLDVLDDEEDDTASKRSQRREKYDSYSENDDDE